MDTPKNKYRHTEKEYPLGLDGRNGQKSGSQVLIFFDLLFSCPGFFDEATLGGHKDKHCETGGADKDIYFEVGCDRVL